MYYIHVLARVYMHVLVHNRKTCVLGGPFVLPTSQGQPGSKGFSQVISVVAKYTFEMIAVERKTMVNHNYVRVAAVVLYALMKISSEQTP